MQHWWYQQSTESSIEKVTIQEGPDSVWKEYDSGSDSAADLDSITFFNYA